MCLLSVTGESHVDNMEQRYYISLGGGRAWKNATEERPRSRMDTWYREEIIFVIMGKGGGEIHRTDAWYAVRREVEGK